MPEPLARDTTLAAEAWQIGGFREHMPTERLRAAFDLCGWAMTAARDAIRRSRPELSELQRAQFLYGLQFGADRAHHVLQLPTVEGSMSIPAAIIPVVEVLERLQVRYYIGGSIASIAYSLPRTTYNVDMLTDMELQHAHMFVQALRGDYYVDLASVIEAISFHTSFSMTHQATHINIDIFISAKRPFDDQQLSRAQSHLLPGAERSVNLASPEDVVLNKLAWYELGNRVSDQQWRDIQSIIRVQAQNLDLLYLLHWASELHLAGLLDAALRGERPGSDAALHQERLL